MTDKLRIIIKEESEKLPKETREAIESVDWDTIVESAGKKFNLTEEELNDLQAETFLVLIGLEDPDAYAANLETNVDLMKEDADKLAGEIKDRVFVPVREYRNESIKPKIEPRLDEPTGVIEEKLDKRFINLSEVMKKRVIETGYHEKLYTIARANKLNIEQMGILEEVVTEVLTGEIHADVFADRIKSRITLPLTEVNTIVNSVNAEILKPLREKMEGATTQPKNPILEIKPVQAATPKIESGKINIKLIKPDLSIPELPKGKEEERRPEVKTNNIPIKINPVLDQKLGSNFKAPKTETEYTLNRQAAKNTIKVPVKSYPPKGDPYRVYPE